MSKLRLTIANAKKADNVKELSLEQNGNEITVSDGEWSIITFRVNDEGKIVFARNESIEDDNYLVDEEGNIVEVDEY